MLTTNPKRLKPGDDTLLLYRRFGQPDLRPLAHGRTIQIVDTEKSATRDRAAHPQADWEGAAAAWIQICFGRVSALFLSTE